MVIWPKDFKIIRVHPFLTTYMCAKFDVYTFNDLVSIVFPSFLSYLSIVTLTLTLKWVCSKHYMPLCIKAVKLYFSVSA